MTAQATKAGETLDNQSTLDPKRLRRIYSRYSVADLDTMIRVLTELRESKLATNGGLPASSSA
jgi:hypothetical protein